MALSGYVKIGIIAGESRRSGHEGEIDVHSVAWSVTQRSSANLGSGRTRGRAEISDVSVRKLTDAATPYLALASMTGQSLDDIAITLRRDAGESHVDYLVITLENCAVSAFRMIATPEGSTRPLGEEEVNFTAERITIRYVEPAGDLGGGAGHEVSFDIVAGRP